MDGSAAYRVCGVSMLGVFNGRVRRAWIMIAVAMGGCAMPPAGSEIGIVSATPASVEIFGRSSIPGAIGPQAPTATDQEIADLAQKHCQQYGRDARKLSVREVPGARYVLFDCVPGYDVTPTP